MKQLPNYAPKQKKIKKSWIPLAIFALVCNALIVYVYVNKHKNNEPDLTVSDTNKISSKVSTNPNVAIDALPHSPSNEGDISTDNQNYSTTVTASEPIPAIMVKKTTIINAENKDEPDKTNSSSNTDHNGDKTAIQDKNQTTITALQTADENDQQALKQAKATQDTSVAATTDNNKSETTQTSKAQDNTDTKAGSVSGTNTDDTNRQATTTTASTKQPASQTAKANSNTQTKSKPNTNTNTNKFTSDSKSTSDSAGIDWQARYGNVTGSKPIDTAPVRRRPTEQEIQDASLLAIDLPASQRRQIPTNSSATRELQAKTNAVKSNTEALQGQLSDTIKTIKDINQQKIERDRQMAQRAYDDLQRINQLKQQQDLAGQIDTTEAQLEQSTLNNPPNPE